MLFASLRALLRCSLLISFLSWHKFHYRHQRYTLKASLSLLPGAPLHLTQQLNALWNSIENFYIFFPFTIRWMERARAREVEDAWLHSWNIIRRMNVNIINVVVAADIVVLKHEERERNFLFIITMTMRKFCIFYTRSPATTVSSSAESPL